MSDTVILAPTWRANFLGLLLVLLGGLFITTLTWIVRSVADDINPLQAGFMRYAFGTLLLLPLAFKIKATDLAPRLVGGHIIRSIVHAISVLLWFYASMSWSQHDLPDFRLGFWAGMGCVVGALSGSIAISMLLA